MSLDNIESKEVKDQYNRFPYPTFSWLAKVDPVAACHASYETGSALVHHEISNHSKKKIALLGCGTFEPYVQGSIHPKAEIYAVDLSKKSLDLAKRRCFFRKTKNVAFTESNLIEFCSAHPEEFDFIHCYGVLHHLPQPQRGFSALSSSLTSGGFARIMVYSRSQRRKTQLIRQAALNLGLTANTPFVIEKLRSLVNTLSLGHPLRLSQLRNSELSTKSGTVDSLIHACETSFTLAELLSTLKAADLYIQAWDFSQNLLSLLTDAPGRSTEDKIEFLEAFDQWPGPFTFWVAKTPPQESALAFRTNPLLRGNLRSALSSTVLKTKVTLSPEELELLQFGLENNLNEENVRLLRARFILGVRP